MPLHLKKNWPLFLASTHPQKGQLLLASSDGAAVGCVALREVDKTSCEMKRMFVYEQFHGRGVGRALAEMLVAEARGLGYKRMLLDPRTPYQ